MYITFRSYQDCNNVLTKSKSLLLNYIHLQGCAESALNIDQTQCTQPHHCLSRRWFQSEEKE